MRKTLASLALMAGVLLFVVACSDPQKAALQHVQRGDQYLKDGKDAEALLQYRNAVDKDPMLGEARKKLGTAYARAGNAKAAMGQLIRAADLLPEDAEATMPLFRELWAEEVVTAPGLVHWIEQQPERAAMRAWVAEARREIVGFANSRLRWALQTEGIAGIWSGVLPAFRRRGLGTRLFETAAAHIVGHGARRLESTVRNDQPDARAFARRLGFEEGRSEQYWELEVGSAAGAKAEPAGEVSVVRLREVRDRERELFDLYDSAERDMPDDYTHAMAFEDWLPETLGNPEQALEVRGGLRLCRGRGWLIRRLRVGPGRVRQLERSGRLGPRRSLSEPALKQGRACRLVRFRQRRSAGSQFAWTGPEG